MIIVNEPTTPKHLKGKFIIASPALHDPNFASAVVLIVQHDDNGALGLIINRPLDVTIDQAWGQISELPCLVSGPLHQGGPCEGPLMVLHTDDSHGQIELGGELFCTTAKDDIETLVTIGDPERPMKFFVNYAGWSEGQLESELAEGAWLVTSATVPQIFSLTGDDLWRRLMNRAALLRANPWLNPKLIPEDPNAN